MARDIFLSVGRGARWSRVIAGSALIVSGLVLATAIVLWIHYGTTVFFQMLAAGFAACF
jgi:hypothetical protein